MIINKIFFTNNFKINNLTSRVAFKASTPDKNTSDVMNIDNIKKRMCKHSINIFNNTQHKQKYNLVKVDVDKFDKYYSQDYFYISENRDDELMGHVVRYLMTGSPVESPLARLTEENGELKIGLLDGRHRYAVLKRLGMKVMPITMTSESKSLAQKYGLIAEE